MHFGVLAPLGLLGLWLSRTRRQELWPYYAAAAVYTVSVALFFVLSRYRFPLAPLLAVFGGGALAWAWQKWRERNGRNVAGAILVFGLAVALCNLPLFAARPMTARTQANIGRALSGLERHDEAIEAFRRAVALDPDRPVALARARKHPERHPWRGATVAAHHLHAEPTPRLDVRVVEEVELHGRRELVDAVRGDAEHRDVRLKNLHALDVLRIGLRKLECGDQSVESCPARSRAAFDGRTLSLIGLGMTHHARRSQQICLGGAQARSRRA